MQQYVDDLEAKLHDSESEVENMKQESHFLKTTLEEKTVQLEAQARFEQEYDAQVGRLLEQKDEEVAIKEKEASKLVAKLAGLEQELGRQFAHLVSARTGCIRVGSCLDSWTFVYCVMRSDMWLG